MALTSFPPLVALASYPMVITLASFPPSILVSFPHHASLPSSPYHDACVASYAPSFPSSLSYVSCAPFCASYGALSYLIPLSLQLLVDLASFLVNLLDQVTPMSLLPSSRESSGFWRRCCCYYRCLYFQS